MVRTVRKQLLCPQCATVLGSVSYRRFPLRLVVFSTDGLEIPPESLALQLQREKQQVGDATGGPVYDRVSFLERNFAERVVYDLRCAGGHSTLRTIPELVRSVRRAAGPWVDLRA